MAETVVAESNDEHSADELITSSDPEHPANQIPELCRNFYTLGWVRNTVPIHIRILR
jgi:methylthioribulose-1-phosphate dehydratase